MTETDARPTVDFDHHGLAHDLHPYEALRRVREQCPIAWSERHGGFWVVAGYSELSQVFRDQQHFSSSREFMVEDGSSFNIPSYPTPLHLPTELDPPEHIPYRRLLNEVLSPAAVERMRPRVEYWTTYFLDQVIEQGACDLTYDYTSPVPGAVTLEWLGLGAENAARVSHAYHDALGWPASTDEGRKALGELGWVHEWVREELGSRVAHPRDDLLSWLLRQQIDDRPIEFEKALSIALNLVGGGVDTTTNGAAWAIWHLHRTPEHRQRLIAEPELWPTAVEELLRRYPPVLGVARTVRADIEIAGCPMRVHDRVLMPMASACHDEKEFVDPSEVVLDRFPNRHLAFGLGPHRCAGMHLARLEIVTMLRQLLDRAPDYAIDEERASMYPDQGDVCGWTSQPATFTPGPRLLG